ALCSAELSRYMCCGESDQTEETLRSQVPGLAARLSPARHNVDDSETQQGCTRQPSNFPVSTAPQHMVLGQYAGLSNQPASSARNATCQHHVSPSLQMARHNPTNE